MKKILFIDTWLRGLTFINPVNDIISTCNSTHFVHMSSFYGVGLSDDLKLKYMDEFNGAISDLADYKSFDEMVSIINPDLVIFISMHGPFQRYFNIEFVSRKIPTLFYMHGSRFQEQLPNRLSNGILHYCKRVLFYFNHLRKLISLSSNFLIKIKVFLLFIELFLFKNKFNNNPYFKFGLDYDCVFLNDKADLNYYDIFLGGKKFNYTITGNVSIIKSCLRIKDFNKNKKNILILSQPNIIDENEFKNLTSDVEFFAGKYGLNIIVRLHPAEDDIVKEKYIKAFSKDIIFDTSSDISDIISTVKICVGFNTNALCISNYLKIPSMVYVSKQFIQSPYLVGDFYFHNVLDIVSFFSNNSCDVFVDNVDKLIHPGLVIKSYIDD